MKTLKTRKKLADYYRFLRPRDTSGALLNRESYPLIGIDNIPWGWYDLFFEMCDEIKDELEHLNALDDFYFIQVKEKQGGLVCEPALHLPIIDNIIQRYEKKSRETCVDCGEPANRVRQTSPLCPNCREWLV